MLNKIGRTMQFLLNTFFKMHFSILTRTRILLFFRDLHLTLWTIRQYGILGAEPQKKIKMWNLYNSDQQHNIHNDLNVTIYKICHTVYTHPEYVYLIVCTELVQNMLKELQSKSLARLSVCSTIKYEFLFSIFVIVYYHTASTIHFWLLLFLKESSSLAVSCFLRSPFLLTSF